MAFPLQKQTSLSGLQDQLNGVIPDYQDCLTQQGLDRRWTAELVGTAWHLVTWSFVNGIRIAALDIRKIAGFVSHDCSCPGKLRARTSRARSQPVRFLAYLMDADLTEMSTPIVESSVHVDAFIYNLSDHGYSDTAMRASRLVCRHFIVWLYLSDLTLDQIDDGVIQRFLEHECACSCPHFFNAARRFAGTSGSRARIANFADFLACDEVIECWRAEAPPAARSELAKGFLDWMRRHRGARESTIRSYDGYLRRTLLPDLGNDPVLYDVGTIRAAFANWAQSNSSYQLAQLATVLRTYLRYLGAKGCCRPELVGAVASVRIDPKADLPRYVSDADIEALIASCDTSTPIGMRDHAIMLLLARLALRAGDIVALQLDDIDWEQSRIRVNNGKSRRSVALPLPQDAGDSLKTYILRARPRLRNDFVFLRSRTPHRNLSSESSVADIVRSAMKRVGIDGENLPAAHLFRHSRATSMLRGGASLETVATLLRHQSIASTTLYARVDRPMLLEVAQPWPGDAP